jgi:chromosome segregation ATPase
MALHGQISTLEVKNRQLEDDMQFADSTTTSQMERLNQIEAEYKQLADKFTEVDRELKRVKRENEKLAASLTDATSKCEIFETEAQTMKDTLQAEEANKLTLQKLLEEKESVLSAQMNEFRQYKV